MATAATDAVEAPKPKKGLSKKLIIILAVVLLLVVGGAAAAVYVMKQRAAAAAAAAEEDGEAVVETAHDSKKKEAKGPPTFLPLDPFVVNLADRDQERYAQVGVTLEVVDAKSSEELKAYMPAIRNAVLMILAHKTAAELLDREGKVKLAQEILRESVRPLGIEVELPDPAASAPPKKKKRGEPEVASPVRNVHFSSFIIQ